MGQFFGPESDPFRVQVNPNPKIPSRIFGSDPILTGVQGDIESLNYIVAMRAFIFIIIFFISGANADVCVTTSLFISRYQPISAAQLTQMSADFADRAPLVREPYPLQAGQPDQPDQWPMVPTAIVSVFVLFLLGSFILFACHRFAADTHPSVWQRNQHVRPPPPPPPPLCPETVAALPVIRAGSYQGFHCCAVCLAEYEEREMVKLMPVCGHAFHPQCIDLWLLSRGSCPVCRCSDLLGSTTGELRVDVFESRGEGREEEYGGDTHRKLGRSRSCNSKVAVQGTGGMVFLQRSCSF